MQTIGLTPARSFCRCFFTQMILDENTGANNLHEIRNNEKIQNR